MERTEGRHPAYLSALVLVLMHGCGVPIALVALVRRQLLVGRVAQVHIAVPAPPPAAAA